MNSSAIRPGTGLALLATAVGLVVAAPLLGQVHAERVAFRADRISPRGETPQHADRSVRVGAVPDRRSAAALPAAGDFRRFAPIVEKASRAYGVEAALVHAVIFAESSYDPEARSPAGAAGLMQLMPGTARHYGVKDLFDPSQNIHGGVNFLRDLLRQFDGNVELALAAYNAGTTAVIRAGHRIPPLAETQAYVPKVIDHYRRLRALEG